MRRVLFIVLISLVIASPMVLANVPSVTITGPQQMGKDQNITLVIEVKHSGSDSTHYVEWVSLYIDNIDQQITYSEVVTNWLYNSNNFVSDPSWTLSHEVSPPLSRDGYPNDYDIEYLVEANCNIHGRSSSDTVTVRVKVEDDEIDETDDVRENETETILLRLE